MSWRKQAEPEIWKGQIAQAIALQQALREDVVIRDDFAPLRMIAGVDVSYDLARGLTRAVIVLMEYETLDLRASAMAFVPTEFPYVPGLLSFREIPAILEALSCLPAAPNLLMVDGQGIAHPHRIGIAAHLGVVTGLPAIGVGKSKLTGIYEEPGPEAGDMNALKDRKSGEMIGTVLRSKARCNPLFISPGHRVGQDSALEITRHCLRGYRLPEPTRLADQISKWKI